MISRKHIGAMAVAAVVAGLALAGCSVGDAQSPSRPPTDGCEAFAPYGDLSGKSVSVYTNITAPEDQQYKDMFAPFAECTGATVELESSRDFEAQLTVRVQGGNPPDIALIPSPGVLASIAGSGAIKPAPQSVIDNVDKYYSEDWRDYGTVDGVLYGAPSGAFVKSIVWYSPSVFGDGDYEIPTTWDQMVELSDQMAADGIKPWCAGIASGTATGWPLTDWVEDVILRQQGVEFYDQWVAHDVPFTDERVVEALDTVGDILKNPDYVNGGIGDVESIASTTFQDAGLPVGTGQCGMYHIGDFYGSIFPEGTKIGEDGDVFAFPLPPEQDGDAVPTEVGGEFAAAFADRPEVQAFQAYLSSPEAADAQAASTTTSRVSPNTGVDTLLYPSPVSQLSASILTDAAAVIRYDGSDLMPAAVGSGSFWQQMTNWITGQSTEATLEAIEASWPSE